MITPESVVQTRALTREFRAKRRRGELRGPVVRAVDDLTLSVARGESVGYIGANGAGKSTTIKMLTGILVPTSGEVRTCGLDPTRRRRDLARRIGVVFGQRSQLWWDLPLRDTYPILAAIHGLSADEERRRTGELVDGVRALGEKHRVRVATAGHLGDGNMHPAVLYSPGDTPEAVDEKRRAYAAFEEIMQLGLDLGGTITGEHGVGRLKANMLPVELGETNTRIQRELRRVFDPKGILNPGVVLSAGVVG